MSPLSRKRARGSLQGDRKVVTHMVKDATEMAPDKPYPDR
jgi:hypothetical protein